MLVRAKQAIWGLPKGKMQPGDVFVISDDEAQRLLKLDAVEPVRKTIDLQVDVTGRNAKDDTGQEGGE